MRAHDWESTPLGPPETWPQSLRSMVSVCLNSPMLGAVLWGRDLLMLYNDAYIPSMADRHPRALGCPVAEVWGSAWDQVSAPFYRALATGEGFAEKTVELPVLRQGRLETTYWDFTATPIRGEDGSIVGLLNQGVETTEQVLALRDLRDSDERLNMALSAGNGIGTWDWDVPGDRVTSDIRFAQLYGVDPAKAAAGAPISAFFGGIVPDDLPALQDAIKTAMKTGDPFSSEYRIRQPDGSIRWVAAQGRCMLAPDGAPLRFPGVSFDITERKAAEDKLHVLNETLEQRVAEREATLRDTADFARLALSSVGGVGVWTYDVATDRFFCDASIAELYGIDAQKGAAGIMRADFVANVLPEDMPRLRATMAGGLERSGDLELEYRIRHPDGSTRWVLSKGHTYHDEAGTPVRRTGIGIDMTRQRQLEEHLRQSQKMEAVGQLTGGVAHDFNNLLTVIRSSIDLLKRPNLVEERRIRYIEAISDTTTRAAKLTGQLLAFARRQALKPEVFDVAESVSGISDMVRTLTGSRIRIETQVPDRACFVNADASQFETALVNMAVNGRDAMDGEGTLTITVGTASCVPALRAHPAIDGDFVTVALGDTGVGIAPSDLERIFEPFFTTKRVGQGTGLGLSQVFGFVKQSGGEVEVESEPRHGTTFRLYLPEVAGNRPPIARHEDQPSVDGNGTCVLVVEDNADVGSFATQTLKELGYHSVLATDGESALAELAKDADRFDVVFSDVIMPGMTGIELGQQIRRLYPDLPVVLTSGYSHVLARNGTFGFELLHKPYSIEQLSRVLQKAAHWPRLKRVLDS